MTYVGKVMRWLRRGSSGDVRVVNEFVILWEEDERMLVLNCKNDHLQWLNHARHFVGKPFGGGSEMDLVNP